MAFGGGIRVLWTLFLVESDTVGDLILWLYLIDKHHTLGTCLGALVAQWVKRWPTDLADRVRSLLEVKSSQP